MDKRTVFGWHVSIDLGSCNPNIKSMDGLIDYAKKMCAILDMVAFGEPIIVYFGTASPITAGYSLVQLVETSAIMGHFSDHYNSAHIDIFSCKEYDEHEAVRFTTEYFGGKLLHYNYEVRYCE